ncbi:MAG TPA: outer membrane beta-barrel protein [Longimicrobiales bacterium]
MLAIALVTVAAQNASAQGVRTREGFWFNAGLGAGSLGCQDCGNRENGLSGGLAIGGTLSQKLALGVSSNAWTKSQNGSTLSVGALTAMVRFYPSSTGNFFLLGGLGLGTVRAEVSGFGSDTETGGAAILGLGYDFRVARNFSLTPYWNGVGISTTNSDANFGQIGLGITVH